MRGADMDEDDKPNRDEDTSSDDSEVDWKGYVYHEESEKEAVHLDGKDYVALFIASLETTFLPLVLLGLLLIVLGLIFRFI
jgi:hypothetical protein